MPFNPDEYLAKKEAAVAGPSASPEKAFDPNAYIQSKGIQTLPNQGNVQSPSGPSVSEAIGRGAAQGATGGFGDELSAAAGALIPTGTDEALNRSYGERYSNLRDLGRQADQQAASAHPVISALSEIAAGTPLSLASGAGLGKLGYGTIRQAGIVGGLYGLGSSKKEDVATSLEDSAKTSLFSMGLAKLMKVGGSLLSKNTEPVAEIVGKPGNFEIKYGSGLKDSFKLGQEMESALTNPETQQTISRELNAQQPNIQNAISTTKQSLGQKWGPLMDQHGEAPSNVEKAFSNIYNKIKLIAPEGDDVAAKAQDALSARVKGIEEQLLNASPSGSLKDVPLKAVAEAQQALGNIVFEQGAYRKVPAVNGAAKNFFGQLAQAFETADKEAGSGGDLTNINKAYSALYKMQENKLTGATISKLASDPQSTAALKAYDSFIKPLADLDPGIRASLAPDLDSYISNDFQKALSKAQIMKKISGRDPSTTNEGIIGWALKKAYLGSGSLDKLANKAGALSANPTLNALSQPLQSTVQGAAPTVGSLMLVK